MPPVSTFPAPDAPRGPRRSSCERASSSGCHQEERWRQTVSVAAETACLLKTCGQVRSGRGRWVSARDRASRLQRALEESRWSGAAAGTPRVSCSLQRRTDDVRCWKRRRCESGGGWRRRIKRRGGEVISRPGAPTHAPTVQQGASPHFNAGKRRRLSLNSLISVPSPLINTYLITTSRRC